MWANFLYVNNFLPIEQQFMGWAWSLAIEEQFYILFPVALILLMKLRPRYRMPALAAATLVAAGVFVRLLLTSPCPVPPPFQEIDPGPFLCYFDTLYDKFHTRFGALPGGRHGRVPLQPHAGGAVAGRACGLAAAAARHGVSAAGPGDGVRRDARARRLLHVPSRSTTSICSPLASATSSCSRSPTAAVDRSWRGCWPPGCSFRWRSSSYSAYLVHPTVIIAVYLYVFPPTQIAAPMALVAGVALAIVCFSAAAALFLFVERPAMNARERYVAAALYQLARSPSAAQPPRDVVLTRCMPSRR